MTAPKPTPYPGAAARGYVRGPDADPDDLLAVRLDARDRWRSDWPADPWRSAGWLLTDYHSRTARSRYRSVDEWAR